jgi:hypothetical protein
MSDTLVKGYQLFIEKLKAQKCKLKETNANGTKLRLQCEQNGDIVANMSTPEEVANAIYRAAVKIAPQLDWEVKPALLNRRGEGGEGPTQARSSIQIEEDRQKKKKVADAKAEYDKAQEEAKKTIESLIRAVVVYRNNGKNYTATEAIQKSACAIYEQDLKSKSDLRQTLKRVRQTIADGHEAEEKSAQDAFYNAKGNR